MISPGSFVCDDCGADAGTRHTHHRCPECSGALSFVMDDRAFPQAAIGDRPADLWRYTEAIPAFDEPISVGEVVTPLVPVRIGSHDVLVKCEFTMASGSYKDRGAAFLMSFLKSVGVSEACEDSSGNAGASLAAYAARAGIHLKVFCPESASAGKLAQIQLYGAEVVRVAGPRSRATEALLDHVETHGAVYASHSWHPMFLEGLRTMAYEIVEQLDWSAPDVVVCPVGGGSILLGLYEGFSDLAKAGAIERVPALVAVQAENVCPVVRAFEAGSDRVDPQMNAEPTLAEGIALPAPARDRQVLRALKTSGGGAVTVSEEEIAAAVRSFGRLGLCVEPTSAVVWSGFERFQQQHSVNSDASVVLILSGHGLKASESIAALVG